jgi:hypothetical protein
MMLTRLFRAFAMGFLPLCILTFGNGDLLAQRFQFAHAGYSLRLTLDTRGTVGLTAYQASIGGTMPCDTIGVQYPAGALVEHIYGSGLWVGGKLDTSQSGTGPAVRLVSTAYEGWYEPYCEFFTGSTSADTIWKVQGRSVARPQGWDAYWGDLIPRSSLSDNDHYVLYDDAHVRVSGHTPLNLRVAQSCYVWQDPYADAIAILEYRFVNIGTRPVDSVYIGFFMDADVGPSCNNPNYGSRNYTAYYPESRTGFIHNPADLGSTPIGVSLLYASRPWETLRLAYRWWPGPSHPGNNAAKYTLLSSGLIDSNQASSNLIDTRCLLSVGPFTFLPDGVPDRDTVVVAFALVSGANLSAMQVSADRARRIYLAGGEVSVDGRSAIVPDRFMLNQNYPNPFNPSTHINYELPDGGKVQLVVFDVLGRAVETLVNDVKPAGRYSIDFSPKDLSSGVYFCRLQAGGDVRTIKLVFAK